MANKMLMWITKSKPNMGERKNKMVYGYEGTLCH